MKKYLLFFILALVLCVTSIVMAEEKQTLKIGVSFPTFENDSYVNKEKYLYEEAARYSEERGIDIQLSIVSADNNATTQNSQIKDLINDGCDVIAAAPVDNTSIWTSVEAVHEAGIPFVCMTRAIAEGATEIQTPDASYYVDAYTCAYDSAKYVLELMVADGYDPKDIVAIEVLGDLTDQNAINYSAGFNAIAKEMGITVAAQAASEWSVDTLYDRLPAVVAANQNFNFLWNPSDFLLDAELPILEDREMLIPYGEEGHIYIASSTGQKNGFDALLEGYVDAITVDNQRGEAKSVIESSLAMVIDNVEPDSEMLAVPLCTRETFEELRDTGYLWGWSE